jgi:hypothetical protein
MRGDSQTVPLKSVGPHIALILSRASGRYEKLLTDEAKNDCDASVTIKSSGLSAMDSCKVYVRVGPDEKILQRERPS